MKVELSQQASQRIETLVEEGAYPSVEAAVEAALEQFDHPDFAGIDMSEVRRRADRSVASGSSRELDGAYEAELREKLDALRSDSPAT